ncbi:hypothetical protein V7128_14150 [Neobacillus vireti]|uniref:hypothetical protein n=1 Tax=Neobacillus vireti TaxID=220686 RepID=UPI003000C25A
MSVKSQRWLNIAMVVLAWSTLPFMGLNNLKRFFPASLFIGAVEVINAIIGKKRKWWVFYHKPNSYLFGELPYNIGPFMIISMWILKWTFGNFKRFMILNALLNGFFAFPFSIWADKVRYYKLVRFNHLQFFLYFFSKSFLFYGFQWFLEKKMPARQSDLVKDESKIHL